MTDLPPPCMARLAKAMLMISLFEQWTKSIQSRKLRLTVYSFHYEMIRHYIAQAREEYQEWCASNPDRAKAIAEGTGIDIAFLDTWANDVLSR